MTLKSAPLVEEIQAAIEPIRSDKKLYQLVRDCLPLAEPGTDQRQVIKPLFLLPMLVCEAVSGRVEPAVPVAAALQLFRAAGDLFDDLEDNDFQGTAIAVVRPGIAINVATMLLILAEKALLRLGNRGVNASTISQVIDIINTAYEKACIGQHLDLGALRRKMLTEKAYLKIAELKTATSVECACRTGALVAGADNELIDKFALLGNNLGMASQIANDIQGILNLKDVLKPKMTLPVIFALSQSEASVRDRLSRVFRQAETLVKEARQIRRTIIEAGAVQYATIKLEYYKLRAWDYLHEIEATGAKIDQLKILFK